LNIAGDATGANLLFNLAQGLYPNSKDSNGYAVKATKTLGGPTISDAVKLVQAGFDASKGKVDNAKRFGLTHVPIVGTPVSNRAVPYADQKTAPAIKNVKDATPDQLKSPGYGKEAADLNAKRKSGGFGIT
jgi:hypothetical protein